MLDASMILEQDLMKKILDLAIGWKRYDDEIVCRGNR